MDGARSRARADRNNRRAGGSVGEPGDQGITENWRFHLCETGHWTREQEFTLRDTGHRKPQWNAGETRRTQGVRIL